MRKAAGLSVITVALILSACGSSGEGGSASPGGGAQQSDASASSTSEASTAEKQAIVNAELGAIGWQCHTAISGDWIVGAWAGSVSNVKGSELCMRSRVIPMGVNWKTGATWTAAAPSPSASRVASGEFRPVAVEGGVALAQWAEKSGGGLDPERLLTQMVVLDPATGKAGPICELPDSVTGPDGNTPGFTYSSVQGRLYLDANLVSSHTLTRLDPKDCKIPWTTVVPSQGIASVLPELGAADKVFGGLNWGMVDANSGSLLWSAPADKRDWKMSVVAEGASLATDRNWSGGTDPTSDFSPYWVDTKTGTPTGEAPPKGTTGMDYDGVTFAQDEKTGYTYTASVARSSDLQPGTSTIIAWDTAGKQVWSQQVNQGAGVKKACYGHLFVVGGFDGKAVAYDEKTGTTVEATYERFPLECLDENTGLYDLPGSAKGRTVGPLLPPGGSASASPSGSASGSPGRTASGSPTVPLHGE